MKPILLVLVLVLTSVQLHAEGDYVRRGLEVHGTPHALRLYDAHNSPVLREQVSFDPQGRIRSRVSYAENGEFRLQTRYERGAAGNLKTVHAYNRSGALQWRHKYRYQDSRVQQKLFFNAAGELEYTDLYRYDRDDNLIEQARYAAGGVPRWRTHYDYEDRNGGQGRRVQWTVYYSDGRIIRQGVEKYDEEGRVTREVRRDEVEQTYEEVHYEYDYRGRLVAERTIDARGALESVRRLRYDHRDSIVEEIVSRFDGTVRRRVSYEYRYDEHGNWVERITVEREKPQFGPVLTGTWMHRREILYRE
ncbi:MAG: hypothetical protein EA384_09435 [Spirochaetaceae bacterium]|nr:MAG: hypothetical protein EA384_09435 [Spirochaetaceae bacterium]